MSRTTLVVLLAYTLTPPPIPAGTIAALALIRPSKELRVETTGWDCPVGQMVRNPRVPPCGGTTVTFSEYATAALGMLQVLCGMAKLRVAPPEWLVRQTALGAIACPPPGREWRERTAARSNLSLPRRLPPPPPVLAGIGNIKGVAYRIDRKCGGIGSHVRSRGRSSRH